jgi:hypothetical protein
MARFPCGGKTCAGSAPPLAWAEEKLQERPFFVSSTYLFCAYCMMSHVSVLSSATTVILSGKHF